MTQPLRYREIEVSGTPRKMGRQIGEAAREEIRAFSSAALDIVNKTVAVSRDRAMSVAQHCIEKADEYSRDMVDELRGMSDGSGVPLDELMLLQVRNQLTPDADAGCTSLAVGRSAAVRGNGIVAQNWDNDPSLDDFTIVLTRRPADKPALIAVTQAGLIAYIGMNDAGIGLCLNTLPAPSRSHGVPHYFTVRGIYETDSLDRAAHAVRRASRAIPANIMMITPQGPADLEVTLDNVHVLQPNFGQIVTHTNHCLHPDLVSINDDFAELIESRPRLGRINDRLAMENDSLTIAQLKAVLRDHAGHPKSICRHENDHPKTGFWTTVFSVIMEPAAGEMHVSRGTPCNHEYEIYRLN